jgi:hypothetical protein
MQIKHERLTDAANRFIALIDLKCDIAEALLFS